jgi:hypothetical protein
MSTLSVISLVCWGVVGIAASLGLVKVQIGRGPITNPFFSLIGAWFLIPLFSLIAVILGLVGLFFLAPVIELLFPQWYPF